MELEAEIDRFLIADGAIAKLISNKWLVEKR